MSSEVQSNASTDNDSSNPLQNSLNKSSTALSPSKNIIESKVVLLGDTGKNLLSSISLILFQINFLY